MKYKIAVSGASEISHCSKDIKKLASEVGREIAKQGCILVTGATTGVPDISAAACKAAGGFSLGFSPAATKLAHKKVYRLPLENYDAIVYTGFDYSGRNLLMTRAADAVIVICGRMGTLNEFTIAYEDKKPIGVLEGSGGTADLIKELLKRPHRPAAKIIFDSNPKQLVKKLIKLIDQKKK